MMVEPPAWLSPEASEVWRGLDRQVLARGDRETLTVYCCAVADYQRAQQTLDQTGVIIKGARGGLVRNPLQFIKAENANLIATLARQLGIGTDVDEQQPRRGRRRRNGMATEKTIAALRAGGRLESVDAATAALARHLAQALDEVDGARWPAQTASLARAHLATLQYLRGADVHDHGSIEADELIALLSTPMGNPPH